MEAALAGIGIGIALAGAPGPVQAVLLSEVLRGGRRGALEALAGVHVTFGALLLALALGLSIIAPEGTPLRLLQAAGGALLLWLAAEGLRAPGVATTTDRRGLPAAARGALAILLNPGGWLFLAVIAAPLVAEAHRAGGRPSALATALALVAGAAMGDALLVFVAAAGGRRLGEDRMRWIRKALSVVLAALGVWLLAEAAVG